MTENATAQPLAGRTVIDLTTALAGPYATLLLAGLGATVIKVENPATGGDTSRNNAPYLGRDGLALSRLHDDDMSVSMLLRGRGKLSVTLNLKDPRSKTVFTDLVRHADVLVENYSPGVTSRLGIDYAAVREINPALVYTSISGFGAQGGPGSGKAMDAIIQALSGVMMTAGEPGGDPVRFGLPVGDLLAPLYAVVGTVSALLQTERTGQGQHVDVSMLGALTSLVACEPFDAYDAVGLEQRTGAMVPRLAPFGILPAADGHVALCAPTDAFARGVLRAMGRADLVDDERYRTRDRRVERADELHALIAAWCRDLPRAEVIARLTAQGVPAAEVRDPLEAVRDPLVRERREVVPLTHPRHGAVADLSATGMPIVFSGSDVGLDGPAPELGQHNDRVYRELLGYDADDVAALTADAVI
ncbi:CaiB/BaiF CoA transferase family protein [Pseudonocardia alni]|uniref:Crotonobetainyl-CoA:carnitine CoA-transferase CaiB-like acyl-CoA transferase n=1 Tax=Pseudonocardia alni TaxID=33907 RepID=A0AA44UQ22_PSEA5|nr:CoA transferase [Pseudonocardia alni]MYW73129.1 CoA transferase [Pseudonocardia sp. SID8383]OJG05835.1 Succinyl-CoA:(R)-benzylsuccinate CoA-transferase subunit BbsF [Pseudonocardia autotrophica]PKB31256.1 crotonobetainyl-CoA:carnitine CoA-transferase CaiB-like acyl-CoA transferase [Pseudonocardia alni]